jgi:hypothetical protein
MSTATNVVLVPSGWVEGSGSYGVRYILTSGGYGG